MGLQIGKTLKKRVKETTLTVNGETVATLGQKSLDHIARLMTNLEGLQPLRRILRLWLGSIPSGLKRGYGNSWSLN